MGILSGLASIAEKMPAVEKPARKPTLYQRLMWTGIVLVLYFVMSNIPLYGVPPGQAAQNVGIMQILFASNFGTLTELGIGPIVTAGLILEILVGAKLIEMDLTDPEDRKVFTGAQTTLAIILGVFEASMYVLACRYWNFTGSPITGCSATTMQKVLVVLQLTMATYIIMLLDQMLQKGWGLGSAISLFILAGVANHMFWQLFGINPLGGLHPGLIPFLFQSHDLRAALLRPGRYADILGLVATITVIVLLVYLQSMKIEIPITTQRLRGIRSKMPLQFIYVTNIPILLVGILVSDLVLFANLAERISGTGSMFAGFLHSAATYLQPPGGFYSVLYNLPAAHYAIYVVSWLLLSVIFGFMWVEIAGLSPSSQAEQLIKSGMEVPGIRRNKRILEQRLAKYIYPLTLLSSLIVGAIAVLADTFGAYGTGSGILLAVGILQQYYMMIAYERTLEAYPFLKRLIGE